MSLGQCLAAIKEFFGRKNNNFISLFHGPGIIQVQSKTETCLIVEKRLQVRFRRLKKKNIKRALYNSKYRISFCSNAVIDMGIYELHAIYGRIHTVLREFTAQT